MNSPDVVAALRAGAPDAAGQLYDAHAEGLFQYCWLVLRSREKAQMAMRDAIIYAQARIAELDDPAMLKAWLFAIARAECDRHCPGSAGESDEPVAQPQQRDAALRIMAWKSVISLPAAEREALDLVTRHGMTPPEAAVVLGLPVPDAPALVTAAQRHLERALAAEILINRESQECADRTEALQGWTGTMTPAVRDRLLRHAGSCPACLPRLPSNVSAPRMFGLIPQPAMTGGGWAEVLSRLSGPEPGDRDAPASRAARPKAGPDARSHARSHAGSRARSRARSHARSEGRPDDQPDAQPRAGLDARPGARPGTGTGGTVPRARRHRILARTGAALAVAAVGAVAVLAAGGFGGHTALSGGSRRLPAAADAPAHAGAGEPIRPVAAAAPPGTGTGHRSGRSRAASGHDGPSGDDTGQLTRAIATATVITPARTPQHAMGVALLPSPAAPAPPGRPAPAGRAAPAAAGRAAPPAPPSVSGRSSVSGQLDVSPGSLDLGTDSTGQIVLTASGGPVSWTAIASSADLTMSQLSGQLSAGQSVTLEVGVRRRHGAAGNGTISFDPAAAVKVTWDATRSAPPSGRRGPDSPDPAAS